MASTKQHAASRSGLEYSRCNLQSRGAQGLHATLAGASPMRHIILAAAIAFAALQFVGSPQRPVDGPVAKALASASSADKARVRSVYGALADLIERDGGKLIATTAVWRAIYSDALRLAAGGTGLVGEYEGLDAAIEAELAQHYPLENLAIDPALAKKIATGCRAVEKQCE